MKLKKMIPNVLTSIRIVVIPLIVFLGIKESYKELAILCIFVSLTDFFDGFLARRFNATSKFGAMLDSFGDKLFAISLLILLLLKRHIFIPILVLELLIAIINLISFYRTRIPNTLLIGKIKTWSLCITNILGIINLFFPKIHILMDIMIVITIALQVITFGLYLEEFFNIGKKKLLKN